MPPPQRSGRKSSRQASLAARLPPTRPPHVSCAEWAALVGVATGTTLAAIGAEPGISRQRVHQMVTRGERKLAGHAG